MSDLEARLREQLADIASSVTVDPSGPFRDRRRTRQLTSVVVGVLVLTLAGAVAWARLGAGNHAVTGPVRSTTTTTTAAKLPSVTSSDVTVRSLWQLDGMVLPTVIDDEVVSFVGVGTHRVVRAVSAQAGTTRWTVALPGSEPDALELLAAQGVVVAVVGHDSGGRPNGPVAALLLVIDARTGRQLWTQSIGGFSQTPPVAIAANLVVTGDPLGNLNARNARTGVRAWHQARPATCPRAGVVLYDEAVVADGSLLAVSYQCSMPTTRRSLVERLDLASGTPTWTWTTPAIPGPLGVSLTVAGAAVQGNTVVLEGGIPPKPASLAASLGRATVFPSNLGTPGPSTVVSIDASTGHPRWNEFGSEGYNFVQLTLVDDAVCESMSSGFECRDDVTGEPTRPVFLSGNRANVIPPIEFDRFVGLTGGTAAAVIAAPATNSVSVELMPITGDGPVGKIKVGISTRIFNGASQAPFVVGSGQFAGGAPLLLIRRVDVSGYPILALNVTGGHQAGG